MAYCGKCGNQVNDDVKFCSVCGNAMSVPVIEIEQNDITNNKAMGVLAYLGPLCFIPIFVAKDSKFVRFHANQGLILFIACVAWSIVYSILSAIILAISWRLYFIVSIIGFLSFVFLVLAIVGIVNVINGREKELPIIGKFTLLK